MTTPLILQQIEAGFGPFWENFIQFQEQWHAQYDTYFQVLWISETIPQDGATITPDIAGMPWPDDQPNNPTGSWQALGMPEQVPFRFRIDQYLGPAGGGFQAVAQIKLTNQDTFIIETWERVMHHGPETWRESDWSIIDYEN